MLTHRVCCPRKKTRWTMLAGGIGEERLRRWSTDLMELATWRLGLCVCEQWGGLEIGSFVCEQWSSVEAVFEISQLFIKKKKEKKKRVLIIFWVDKTKNWLQIRIGFDCHWTGFIRWPTLFQVLLFVWQICSWTILLTIHWTWMMRVKNNAFWVCAHEK